MAKRRRVLSTVGDKVRWVACAEDMPQYFERVNRCLAAHKKKTAIAPFVLSEVRSPLKNVSN